MKFWPTFGAVLLISFTVMFLFGDILFNRGSIFLWTVLFALACTVLIHAHVKLEEKIEALELRIAALEDKEED